MTGSGTCPGRGQSPSPRSRRSPFPSHQGQSLSEWAGQRRESELGEGGALGSTGRAPGARGGVSYLGPGGRRDFGLRTGVSSGTGPAGINPPLEGLPPPAHPPPPTAAGPERGFEAGRPGSALGYRPRLLAAAATAAAGTGAAGHPPPLLLRQLLLLLLPPPPPPRPHRSHRRCGDYCSAPLTRPDVTLPLHKPAQPNTLGLPLRPPTSPPRVLIGERGTSLPRRLADPTAYHEGGGESGRKRIRPLPENRRYLQVCLRGQVTEKGASQ